MTAEEILTQATREAFVRHIVKSNPAVDQELLERYILSAFKHTNLGAPPAVDAMSLIVAPVLVSAGLFSTNEQAAAAVTLAAKDVRHETAGIQQQRKVSAPLRASSLEQEAIKQRERWMAAQKQQSIAELQVSEQGRIAMEQLMRRKSRRDAKKSHASAPQEVTIGQTEVSADGRDVVLKDVTLSFGPTVLLQDASMTFRYGHRYGVVGENGIGKSTLLRQLERRALPVPEDVSILYLAQDLPPSESTVLQVVLEADTVRSELLAKERDLSTLLAAYAEDASPEVLAAARAVRMADYFPDEVAADPAFYPAEEQLSAELQTIYNAMMDNDTFRGEARARTLLAGLGFGPEDMDRRIATFSGGQRVRVSIARALYLQPDILLSDETTNHLDLQAMVFLTEYLSHYPGTLIVVAHEPAFLDSVCTDIVAFEHRHLTLYADMGYTRYVEHVATARRIQQHAYEVQQDKIARMQTFINTNVAKSRKLARAAQTRIKALARMEKIEAVLADPSISFQMPQLENVTDATLCALHDVFFRYNTQSNEKPFQVLADGLHVRGTSRIGLLGANGSGKSTIIKLLAEMLQPLTGYVSRRPGTDVAYFAQFHTQALGEDMEHTALELLRERNPGAEDVEFRNYLGRFGLSGNVSTRPVRTLSGGQRTRLVLALMLYERQPQLLLLDEPANNLSAAARYALASALNEYNGAIIMISHDETLLTSVVNEYWIVKDGRCQLLDGDYSDYKEQVLKDVAAAAGSITAK